MIQPTALTSPAATPMLSLAPVAAGDGAGFATSLAALLEPVPVDAAAPDAPTSPLALPPLAGAGKILPDVAGALPAVAAASLAVSDFVVAHPVADAPMPVAGTVPTTGLAPLTEMLLAEPPAPILAAAAIMAEAPAEPAPPPPPVAMPAIARAIVAPRPMRTTAAQPAVAAPSEPVADDPAADDATPTDEALAPAPTPVVPMHAAASLDAIATALAMPSPPTGGTDAEMPMDQPRSVAPRTRTTADAAPVPTSAGLASLPGAVDPVPPLIDAAPQPSIAESVSSDDAPALVATATSSQPASPDPVAETPARRMRADDRGPRSFSPAVRSSDPTLRSPARDDVPAEGPAPMSAAVGQPAIEIPAADPKQHVARSHTPTDDRITDDAASTIAVPASTSPAKPPLPMPASATLAAPAATVPPLPATFAVPERRAVPATFVPRADAQPLPAWATEAVIARAASAAAAGPSSVPTTAIPSAGAPIASAIPTRAAPAPAASAADDLPLRSVEQPAAPTMAAPAAIASTTSAASPLSGEQPAVPMTASSAAGSVVPTLAALVPTPVAPASALPGVPVAAHAAPVAAPVAPVLDGTAPGAAPATQADPVREPVRPRDPATPALIALPIAEAPPLAAGTTAPAFRLFAAAIHAARTDEDAPAPVAAPAAVAQPDPVRLAVPAAASAQGAPLDLHDHRWPHAMIDRIEQLRDAASEAADAANTSIRLVPDKLGAIHVSVRTEGDTVHVHFAADQAETRALLADAQPRLAELAESRGLKLAGGSVGTGSDGQPQRQSAQQQPATPAAPPPALPRGLGDDIETSTRVA